MIYNVLAGLVHSAVVPSSNIRPVDTSAQALGVKRTSGFVRACGELARHQQLLTRQMPPDERDSSPDIVATSRRKVHNRLTLLLEYQRYRQY